MIVNHETPKASDRPAIHAAISSRVAPRKSSPAASPWPTMRAEDTAGALVQHSGLPVQRRQCAARDEHQHEAGDAHGGIGARDGLAADAPLHGVQQASPSITGKRNAGRPKRKNSTSASQAPTTPMRLWTGPGPPVTEKPGSSGL